MGRIRSARGVIAAACAMLASAGVAGAASPTSIVGGGLLLTAQLGRPWTVQSPAPARAQRLTCRAFSPHLSGVRVRAPAASPTFEQSAQGPFLSQAVYLYGSAAQQRTVRRSAVVPRLLRCVAARFAAGGSGYAVTSSHVSALRRSGGVITRYRIGGTVSGGGQTLPAFLDEIVLGRGALITVLDVSNLQAPPSDSLERHLAGFAADRLRRIA